jgi:hypothetical protein
MADWGTVCVKRKTPGGAGGFRESPCRRGARTSAKAWKLVLGSQLRSALRIVAIETKDKKANG